MIPASTSREWQSQTRREEKPIECANEQFAIQSYWNIPRGEEAGVFIHQLPYHWMRITHGVLTTWNFQSASYAIQAAFSDTEAPLAKKHRKTSVQMTFGRPKRIWIGYQQSLLQQEMGPISDLDNHILDKRDSISNKWVTWEENHWKLQFICVTWTIDMLLSTLIFPFHSLKYLLRTYYMSSSMIDAENTTDND